MRRNILIRILYLIIEYLSISVKGEKLFFAQRHSVELSPKICYNDSVADPGKIIMKTRYYSWLLTALP